MYYGVAWAVGKEHWERQRGKSIGRANSYDLTVTHLRQIPAIAFVLIHGEDWYPS